MSKSKSHKVPTRLHLAGLMAPARTIQSKKKVESKNGARRNKYGRFPDDD